MLLLQSCTLSVDGTYKTQGLLSQTFTFSGDKIIMSAFGVNAEGKYVINGDNMHITYNLFGKDYEIDYFFKREGKNLNIAGSMFYKQ